MNPYFIAGGVVAIVLAFGGGYYKGNSAGQAEVQQKWDKEKADQLVAYVQAQDESRKREQDLQAGADKLRQEKDREIRELNARTTALANSLRNRPERPAQTSGMPTTAGTGKSGCTARELYREDSEVVVRIAREADELRVALKQCYSQYEKVRN
jgi:hypothetical protein